MHHDGPQPVQNLQLPCYHRWLGHQDCWHRHAAGWARRRRASQWSGHSRPQGRSRHEQAEASKNKASFEAEIAQLKATLDAASSEIINLKKLVKDNHHDITKINQGGWIAALIVAIVALVAAAGAGMSLLVRKPTPAVPAGQTLDGKVGMVSVEIGLPVP